MYYIVIYVRVCHRNKIPGTRDGGLYFSSGAMSPLSQMEFLYSLYLVASHLFIFLFRCAWSESVVVLCFLNTGLEGFHSLTEV